MPVLDIDMDAACINLLDLGLIAKVGIAAGTVAVGGANLRNVAAFARGVTLTVANAASWCKQHVSAVCKYVHITKCASAAYNFIVKNASTCGRFAWEFVKAVAKCTFFIGKELFISLCMVAFICLCVFLLIAGCVYLQKFFQYASQRWWAYRGGQVPTIGVFRGMSDNDRIAYALNFVNNHRESIQWDDSMPVHFDADGEFLCAAHCGANGESDYLIVCENGHGICDECDKRWIAARILNRVDNRYLPYHHDVDRYLQEEYDAFLPRNRCPTCRGAYMRNAEGHRMFTNRDILEDEQDNTFLHIGRGY